jgi:hypothetical protein
LPRAATSRAMHGNRSIARASSMGAPYQPTAESTLALKCPNIAKRRRAGSSLQLYRLGQNRQALGTRQSGTSRDIAMPNIRRHTVVGRILPDRNSFLCLNVRLSTECYVILRYEGCFRDDYSIRKQASILSEELVLRWNLRGRCRHNVAWRILSSIATAILPPWI